MLAHTSDPIATCLTLTKAIGTSASLRDIYEAALDALQVGLGVDRASVLLFDGDGVMRFEAARGISLEYRRTVEGHTPWQPGDVDAEPIWVEDARTDASCQPFASAFEREGIAALVFVPLVNQDRLIGKFMLYYREPTPPSAAVLQLAGVIAAQVAFAVERTRADQTIRRSEARLRFALEAASMGTWDWDLSSNTVQWSDNLPGLHGLPVGAFDGQFASYEREIHPDDRARVHASIWRALNEGLPHDVEYRIVDPDGGTRWCEGKGRVEYEGGRPARMTGVCMMVTRRKEAELAKLAEAEETSRLKDEFLATLSHELRTPLNAIVGWVRLLQMGALPSDRQAHAIEVIARNARLQAQLIEDILDVSRIIAGKLEIERVAVSLPHVLDAALSGIAPAAEAKHLTIETEIAPDLPFLDGDPQRLHQVLNNVLSNAVKFTPAGGHLSLRCAVEGSWLCLDVQDTGVGIAPDFLPQVFERFRQADSRSSRLFGGLGLGLAIAKHLVEQHGGAICAASPGEGLGTIVSIRLPVGRSISIGPSDEDGIAPAETFAGRTFLVVDDQEDSRELLATVLESRGARVNRCASGSDALSKLAGQRADLVIADIGMPTMDGYELMRRLRECAPQMAAIAVTAFARPEDRRRALASGYARHLSKPIDAIELARVVQQVLASPLQGMSLAANGTQPPVA